MEVRRAADVLLRSNASPLTALLAPSSSLRLPASRNRARWTSIQLSKILLPCPFSTTSYYNATRPPTTTATPDPSSMGPSAEDGATSKEMANSLWGKNPWTKPSAQTSQHSMDFLGITDPTKDSSSLLHELSRDRSDGKLNIGNMQLPSRMDFESSELMASLNQSYAPEAVTPTIPLRLKPSLGRQKLVRKGDDPARVFVMLEVACAKEKIRADANRQRFHERPGLKRKRLASLRWRKRFMDGFRATIHRVKQLKAQGW